MADQPDFWQSSVVNLILQDLPQVINRPKYGGCQVALFANYAAANSQTTLFTLSGRGMTYSGGLTVTSNGTQENDFFSTVIDGQSLDDFTFTQKYNFGSFQPHGPGPFLICYDLTNFRFAVAVCMGFTFETSLVVKYTETHGRTPYVLVKIVYALVAV